MWPAKEFLLIKNRHILNAMLWYPWVHLAKLWNEWSLSLYFQLLVLEYRKSEIPLTLVLPTFMNWILGTSNNKSGVKHVNWPVRESQFCILRLIFWVFITIGDKSKLILRFSCYLQGLLASCFGTFHSHLTNGHFRRYLTIQEIIKNTLYITIILIFLSTLK